MDPFILVHFDKYEGPDDPIVSLVIFEWKDEDFIGVYTEPNAISVRTASRATQAYLTLTLSPRKQASANQPLSMPGFVTKQI